MLQKNRQFRFQPWVYGAITDGHLVLLDLRRNEYIHISSEELGCIGGALAINPPINSKHSSSNNLAASIDVIKTELLSKNIVVDNPDQGKILSPCHIEPPITLFEHIECDDWPAISWHHTLAAFIAGAVASVMLKCLPMQVTIRIMRYFKRNDSRTSESDIVKLARVYKRLRPFLFRSKICLYDTIAFTIFSRLYGQCPTIIIGVTGEPFQAHCWAQYKGWILNDVPQNIRQYTPIMAI